MAWLQILAWIGAVIAAIFAGFSLRLNALQNRARLLLEIYKSWDELATMRREMITFYADVQKKIKSGVGTKNYAAEMRQVCSAALFELREAEPEKFAKFTNYVGFFELLGVYVRNGYIPLRDVMQVFKGPILLVDLTWRDVIKKWQEESDVPAGLLEHALFLMDVTRTRAERPLYYWTIYHPFKWAHHQFRKNFLLWIVSAWDRCSSAARACWNYIARGRNADDHSPT